jgi:Mn-containing catalase
MLAFLMTRSRRISSFGKALQSIRNNYPAGKLPPIEEYANTYYNMSGGETFAEAGIAINISIMLNPQPAVMAAMVAPASS